MHAMHAAGRGAQRAAVCVGGRGRRAAGWSWAAQLYAPPLRSDQIRGHWQRVLHLLDTHVYAVGCMHAYIHCRFHGDLNETVCVGEVDEGGKALIKATHDALMKAIAACRPGVRYRDLGDIITRHVAAHG